MDNDKDKEYILDGVTNGFNIINDVDKLISYECENYKSAENPDAKPKLDKLLTQEIASGKISQVQDKPQCIHSYGAVPKKGTDELRPVTNCRSGWPRSTPSFSQGNPMCSNGVLCRNAYNQCGHI